MLRSAFNKTLEGVLAGAVLISGYSQALSQQNVVAESAKIHYQSQLDANSYNISIVGGNDNTNSHTSLSLDVISQNANSMNVQVKNAPTNSTIWILDTDELNFDPKIKHWNPIYSFTPTNANTELNIPIQSGNNFLIAMNIDAYRGPQAYIVYPKKNAPIMGEETFEVAAGRDIFPVTGVSMYADGNQLSQLGTNMNKFYYNSQLKLNGAVILQASASNNLQVNDSSPEALTSPEPVYATGWSMPQQAISQNTVCMLNEPEYALSNGQIPIRLFSLAPINVNVKIKDALGSTNTVLTAGTSENETYFPYHFTSIDANLPIDSTSLLFEADVNYSLQNQGPSPNRTMGTNINIVIPIDRNGVRRGEGFYAFGEWRGNDHMTILREGSGGMSYYQWLGAVTVPSWPITRGTARSLVDPPHNLEVTIAKEQQLLNACYEIFGDTHTSEFATYGHGGQRIWVGRAGDCLSFGLDANIVAQRLNNTSTNWSKLIGNDLVMKKRLFLETRYNIFDVSGCSTVQEPFSGWQWNEVFGAPANINQDERPWMQPNAGFGFADTAYMASDYTEFQRYWNTMYRTTQDPANFPIKYVIQAGVWQYGRVMDSSPTLSGSRKVVWFTGQRSNYPN